MCQTRGPHKKGMGDLSGQKRGPEDGGKRGAAGVRRMLYLAVWAAALYGAFRYLLPLTAPFWPALLTVYLCYPTLQKIQKATHIRREILLSGFLLLLMTLAGVLIWRLACAGSVHAAQLGRGMASAQEKMDTALRGCCAYLERNWGLDAAEAERLFRDWLAETAQNFRTKELPEAIRQTWACCRGAVRAAAFVGVGFIASLLICRDYEGLLRTLEREPAFAHLWRFLGETVSVIGGYVRAQGLLMLAVILTAAAGLLSGGVKHAVILALLTGVLDALPFIGSGIVLLPTALWQLLSGSVRGAVCAALAYVLCAVGRELLEPRLFGDRVGICPAVMLLAVYAGVKLFGLSGIFLGPLYAVLLREGARAIWGRENREPAAPRGPADGKK